MGKKLLDPVNPVGEEVVGSCDTSIGKKLLDPMIPRWGRRTCWTL